MSVGVGLVDLVVDIDHQHFPVDVFVEGFEDQLEGFLLIPEGNSAGTDSLFKVFTFASLFGKEGGEHLLDSR